MSILRSTMYVECIKTTLLGVFVVVFMVQTDAMITAYREQIHSKRNFDDLIRWRDDLLRSVGHP